MTRAELEQKTAAVIDETKTALLTLYNALNSGQKKKVLNNPDVAALFDRYHVFDEEAEK